jgi:tetratricopeptide (TPR) repeat protein
VWATSIDETLSDVLTLEDTLSNKVIEVLLPQLTGGELEEFAKRGTDVPEAFEHYLRGRYHFNTFTEEGFAKAFVSFHSAIAADPEYALAYTGIADYYNWLGILGVLPPQECFQPAIQAATKAIEIDDGLSEGHASLGFGLHAGNYEWSKAEHHLRRAMELNPSNANAFVWYSIVLFTEGRFDEGLDFAKRGVEIDPLTPFNHHNRGLGTLLCSTSRRGG